MDILDSLRINEIHLDYLVTYTQHDVKSNVMKMDVRSDLYESVDKPTELKIEKLGFYLSEYDDGIVKCHKLYIADYKSFESFTTHKDELNDFISQVKKEIRTHKLNKLL
mgnify:CR=1 FL=1|jgi:hypothetical protein